MANVKKVKRKPTEIELGDGVVRTIKYTLNSFAEMEDRYGDVDAAIEKMSAGSVKAIRLILWAGLLHNDEKLTEEQVGSLIELDDIQYLSDKMNEAMDADLPDKKEEVKNE